MFGDSMFKADFGSSSGGRFDTYCIGIDVGYYIILGYSCKTVTKKVGNTVSTYTTCS